MAQQNNDDLFDYMDEEDNEEEEDPWNMERQLRDE